jgi:hypothetical protein
MPGGTVNDSPLSRSERARFDEIVRELSNDHRRRRRPTRRTPTARWTPRHRARLGVGLFALGLLILLVGMVLSAVWFGVPAYAALLSGAYLFTTDVGVRRRVKELLAANDRRSNSDDG